MRETAYAKLNLALHVRAREPDGYHRIETIFAFCEDGDVLEVGTPDAADTIELEIVGPFAQALSPTRRGLSEGVPHQRLATNVDPPHRRAFPVGENDLPENLVLRAAHAMRRHFGMTSGARLVLDKRLPVAAGIGGGSADAAAALRLLVRWWGIDAQPDDLHAIAKTLGADVPACVLSRAARGEGRGDLLTQADGEALAGRPVLLVNPLVPVPTAQVFAGWDGVDRGPLDAVLVGRNDLEAPARALAPVIGEVLDALGGAEAARMSGSGATCFGLYADEASRDAAAARIAAAHSNWWLLKSRLR